MENPLQQNRNEISILNITIPVLRVYLSNFQILPIYLHNLQIFATSVTSVTR